MSHIWLAALLKLAMLHLSLAITEEEEQQTLRGASLFRTHYHALQKEYDQDLEGSGNENSIPMPRIYTMKTTSALQRIMGLLKDMKTDLEKEADNDLKIYDDMKCWCGYNSREVQKRIKYDRTCVRDYTDEIEERSSFHGVVSAQIPRMERDMHDIKDAILEADEIRTKEADKYHYLQQDLNQYLINAKNAVDILKTHSQPGASFMQPGSPLISSMQSVLRDLAMKHELLQATESNGTARAANGVHAALLSVKSHKSRITHTLETNEAFREQNRILLDALDVRGQAIVGVLPAEFAQQELTKSAERTAKAGFLQVSSKMPVFESYSSQSGVIFGILQQMQDDFQKELDDAIRTENRAIRTYDILTKNRYAELEYLKDKVYQTKVAKAYNKKRLADAKLYLSGCYREEAEDKGFQDHLKTTCKNLDGKWRERAKARAKEITAIVETMAILTDDDNRETMAKPMKDLNKVQDFTGNFLQVRSTKSLAAHRAHNRHPEVFADGDLMAMWDNHRIKDGREKPRQHHEPRKQLSVLDTSMRKSDFTEIKLILDKQVKVLKQRQADEVQFKADCISDFNTMEKEATKNLDKKARLEDDIEGLVQEMTAALKAIKDAKARITEADKQIGKASQTREEENKEFQEMMAGQYATQEILTTALKRLKRYYTEAEGGDGKIFLQGGGQDAVVPPMPLSVSRTPVETPKQFGEYKKSNAGSSVIGFIEQIIEDSKKLTSDGVANEAETQADYQKTVKSLTDDIKGCEDDIVKNKELLADKKWEHANKQSELDSTTEALLALKQAKADMDDKCGFVLKNFKIRQEGRLGEIEGIEAAKANLDGGMVVLKPLAEYKDMGPGNCGPGADREYLTDVDDAECRTYCSKDDKCTGYDFDPPGSCSLRFFPITETTGATTATCYAKAAGSFVAGEEAPKAPEGSLSEGDK